MMAKRSSRKRMKKASINRLSDLPDGILCHILSFMPTKSSVATSILSRRWRFLWIDVPSLDFDIDDYCDAKEIMSNIINRVIALHKVKTLNRFHLFSIYEEDESYFSDNQMEKWIASAVARNVNNIYISSHPVYHHRVLPRCLFICQTLVDLTLSHCKWIQTAVHFPVLKKFDIDCFIYESDESLPLLLSGCPVLEELIICRESEDGMVCCSISSSTLKRLILTEIGRRSYPLSGHRILINAPALKYLWFRDPVYEHVSAGELPCLVEVDINIVVRKDKDYDLNSRTLLNFVARLCNVKELKLRMIYSNILGSAFSSWTTTFHNLTNLELTADWQFISTLLENADNLKVLALYLVNHDLKCWMEPQNVPTCLSSHLRIIKIYHFVSARSKFEMIGYLLRNAKVLERMEIYSRCAGWESLNANAGFEAIQRISMFQRGSEASVVAFNGCIVQVFGNQI